MPRETALTARIMAYAFHQGCLVRKRAGSAYSSGGWPDVEILIPVDYQIYAVPLYIEVKQPGKTPDLRQRKRLQDLRQAGAMAIWVDNLHDAALVIALIKDNMCLPT